MSTHSVAEAKNRLSQLIDRALKGEDIVITRRGEPVIEFKPVRPLPRPVTPAELDWLWENRIRCVSEKDATTLVREIRDEDDP